MGDPQAGILAPIPPLARYLCFLHKAEADPRAVVLRDLRGVFDGFRYGTGRDLTGYEDGTENPKDENAVAAGGAAGVAGSRFVAVQRWEHSLARFESLSPAERDLIIGRRKSDNSEIDDAPPSSHTKRTAQEQFEPEAFVLRRSMPWADERRARGSTALGL